MRGNRHPFRSRSRSGSGQAGFSLVELMISLVLGLIVIGGVTTVFLSNQQSYRSNEGLSQLQENRSEEHTSELQSLMRISYAVFCLKKKTKYNNHNNNTKTANY